MIKTTIFAAALLITGSAFAASDKSETAPNRSSCGDAHAAAANVNGNFGFLGALGGTPGYHNGATGQEQGATGYNNSHTNCQPD